MSLDGPNAKGQVIVDNLDLDLILSGQRFKPNFQGKNDKRYIKKNKLDPYNNLKPKADASYSIMNQGAAANDLEYNFEKFKESSMQCKLLSQQ